MGGLTRWAAVYHTARKFSRFEMFRMRFESGSAVMQHFSPGKARRITLIADVENLRVLHREKRHGLPVLEVSDEGFAYFAAPVCTAVDCAFGLYFYNFVAAV